MVQKLDLKAKLRDTRGKKVKDLRKNGILPAVLYGHDVKSIALEVPYREFEKVYDKAGGSALISLIIDDKTHNVLIHDVEIEPTSQSYRHADFYAVKMTEKITAEVPLHFIGQSQAVEELDGVLVKNMDALEVSCLPGDLPSHIEVDISSLGKIDDTIHVSDLKVPEEVEILKEKEEVIATVTPPRTEEELAALEEEVSEEEEVEKVEVEKEEAEEGEEGGEAAETKEEEKKEEKSSEKAKPEK